MHIISMDGLKIALTELISSMDFPTCEYPKDELHRTDKLYTAAVEVAEGGREAD